MHIYIKLFQFSGEYIDVLINAIGLISHMEKYKIKFIIHTLYKNKFQVDERFTDIISMEKCFYV